MTCKNIILWLVCTFDAAAVKEKYLQKNYIHHFTPFLKSPALCPPCTCYISLVKILTYTSPKVILFCCIKGLWVPVFKIPLGVSVFLSGVLTLIVTRLAKAFDKLSKADKSLADLVKVLAKLWSKQLIRMDPFLLGLNWGLFNRFS